MPTMADAYGIIGRIFNTNLPKTVYIDLIPNFPFSLLGIGLLIVKDIRDEFMPNRFLVLNSKSTFVRWGVYFINRFDNDYRRFWCRSIHLCKFLKL